MANVTGRGFRKGRGLGWRVEGLESRVLMSATVTGGISLGGTGGEDHINAVVVDVQGTRYVTGYFEGTLNYGSGPGAGTFVSAGGNDVFVMKVTASGDVLWAKQFGSTGNDVGVGLYLDPAGSLLVTGNFEGGMDLSAQGGTTTMTSAGGSDGFLLRIDLNGNLVGAKQFGGEGDDFAGKIVSDKHGGYYLTGAFSGAADLDPGTGSHVVTSSGTNDLFLEKLSGALNLVWVDTFVGGAVMTMPGLAVDALGNAIVGGGIQGEADLDPGAGVMPVATANEVGFVAMYGAGLGRMVWAKTFVGTAAFSAAWVSDVAVDAKGTILVGGDFGGTVDFDAGAGVHTLTETVSPDGFTGYVVALDGMGNYKNAAAIKGDWWTDVRGVTADVLGNFYVTGEVNDWADFNPLGSPVVRTSSSGNNDGFVAKYDTNGKLVWVQLLQGTSISMLEGAAVGPHGELAVIGYFQGDVTVGETTLTAIGTDDALLMTIEQAAAQTTVTLGGIGATAVTGQVLTLTATVSAAVGTPGGVIVFKDGTKVLGTGTLNANGVATLTISGLTVGAHALWASFAGNGDFAAGLGGKSVTVAANVLPAGKVEGMTRAGVTGWAWDANAPSTKVAIVVLVDGVPRATGMANGARTGLVAPGHGFAILLPKLSAGAHLVSVYAVDPGTGKAVVIGNGWVF